MKITLVLDTEDDEGIVDTLKIVNHFYEKSISAAFHNRPLVRQVSYGKIHFIKMLREFARYAVDAHKEGEDPAGLRFAKEYADSEFNKQRQASVKIL